MLCTTRQACTRRIASSIPQALPAESSRQAILRAAAFKTSVPIRSVQSDSRRNHVVSSTSNTNKKSRGISSGVTSHAALALAEDNRQSSAATSSSTASRYSWGDEIIDDRPPDRQVSQNPSSSIPDPLDDYYTTLDLNTTDPPKPEWLDSWLHTYDLSSLPPSPLPPLETFRGLIFSQPLLALLTISKLSQSDYQSIKHGELRSLMHGANQVLRERPSLLNRLNTDDITKSLRILRAILFSLPSNTNSKDHYSGNYFRNRVLRNFLQLCARLNQIRLYKSVYGERLKEQLNSDYISTQKSKQQTTILHFDSIASDLSTTYQWKLLNDLFNPDTFPHKYYTPEIIASYMQSQFGIHQPTKVPRIFQLYQQFNLKPTAESYNYLVQSYLEIGDLPTAREIVKQANAHGISDYSTQQLSILRGYRALGFDLDLEKRVLSDIERLEIPISARLLNALIRLRMEAEDYVGAQLLSKRFDLQDWTQSPANDSESVHMDDRSRDTVGDDKVKPNLATAGLIFELYTQTGDLVTIRTLWKDMKAGSVVINDQIITSLVKALNGLNILDQAMFIFQANPSSTAEESDWSLPKGVKPDIGSLNYFIGHLGRQNGLEGLQSGLSTLHELGVEPNDLTLKIVIDFVQESIHHRPTDLASLVDRITRSSNLKPTQTLLDSILKSAIKDVARSKIMFKRELKPSNSPNTFSSTAGLVLSEKFERSLEGIISALKSIDSKSGSRSLVNRLRYDAMTSSRISNLPSARIVWNSLIQRGYKPDQRHFKALMQGYSDAGLMYQAQDLLLLADQVGVEVTISMWFTLLVGWGRIQRPTFARTAYERIKSLSVSPNNSHKKKDVKLELQVITAMIQAYNKAGYYSEASLLCYTDLRELDTQLDRKAIVVAAQALRSSQDYKGCLTIFEKYGPALDPISRRMVRGIRNYQRKALGLSILSPDVSPLSSTSSSSLPDQSVKGDTNELFNLIEQDTANLSIKEIEQRKSNKEILDLAESLLKADDIARPIEDRRWTRLNNKLKRTLRRDLIGEENIKSRHKEWIKQRKIHFAHIAPHTSGLRGRALRRSIRKARRITSAPRAGAVGRIVNSDSVVIGEVGLEAMKSREGRRRFRRRSNTSVEERE